MSRVIENVILTILMLLGMGAWCVFVAFINHAMPLDFIARILSIGVTVAVMIPMAHEMITYWRH